MVVNIKKVLLIFLVSILSLLLLGGGLAFASDGAKPGDLLYPVDIATEQVMLALTRSEEGKLQRHMKNYEERLDEVEKLRKDANGDDTVRGLSVAIDNIARYQAIIGERYSKMYERFEKGEMTSEEWEKFERRFYELQTRTQERLEKLKELDININLRIEEKRDMVIETMIERDGMRIGIMEEVRERVNELKDDKGSSRRKVVTEEKEVEENPVRERRGGVAPDNPSGR